MIPHGLFSLRLPPLFEQDKAGRQAEGYISTALDSVYNHKHERKEKKLSL